MMQRGEFIVVMKSPETDSYYPVHQHTAPSAHGPTRSESAYGAPEPKGRDKNGVELVSVPVLGPE